MTEDKVTAEVDPNGIDQSYKFLNALLDDYNACKTELARSGISKAFKMLLDQIGKDHAGLACKFNELKKELEAIKAKLPKSKEEIAKLLSEVGFHEPEEDKDVYCHGTTTPPLSPEAYAELYRKYYSDQHAMVEEKLDKMDSKDICYDEFAKIKKTCGKTLAKIANEEERNRYKSEEKMDFSSATVEPAPKKKARRKSSKKNTTEKSA